jgi:uncharacterized membrane protein
MQMSTLKAALAGALWWLTLSFPVAANEYSLTALLPIPGTNTSIGYAINNSGEVVGISQVVAAGAAGAIVGTVWNPLPGGSYVPSGLNPLPGGSFAIPSSVNNRGQIVGQSYRTSTETAAVIWNGATPTALGSFGNVSETIGINNAGRVVGYSGNTDSAGRLTGAVATIWKGSTPTALQPLNNSSYSFATSINDRGKIVGYSGDQAVVQAVVWNGTTPTQLNALGAQISFAKDINNSGQIVGWAIGSSTYGIVWNNRLTPTQLGSLGGGSVANAINNSGSIVGESAVPGVSNHADATIWDGTTVPSDRCTTPRLEPHCAPILAIDLNSLLDSSGSGWTLIDASGINSRGQIVGYGFDPSGQNEGFLLTPHASAVPGPVAGAGFPFSLLIFVGVGLLLWWRRKRCTQALA